MADSNAQPPDPWAAYDPVPPASVGGPPLPEDNSKPDPWATYDPVSIAPPAIVPDQPSAFWDTIKGIPGAAVKGFVSAASAMGQAEAVQEGDLGLLPYFPGPEEAEQDVEKSVIGPLYHSQTPIGKAVSSGVEAIAAGGPLSFIGPAGPLRALAATFASGVGSYEAGEAAHAIAPESPALRTGAELVGGVLMPMAGETAATAARSLRAPPPKPNIPQQFGVTQTPGEVADDLAVRSREATAMRDLNDPRAQAFVAQRQQELAEAPGVATQQMGLGEAGTTNQAANAVTNELIAHKAAADLNVQEVGAGLAKGTVDFHTKLSPLGIIQAESPMEAANIIQGAVANEAERAQAATDAAYQHANELPGHFHPATFNQIDSTIARQAKIGPDPAINPQLTPVASAAIANLEDITGPLKQARDPNTGQIIPRDTPLTMAEVDQARKRLNTYYSAALQGAQGAQRNYTDLNAMRQIMESFDKFVSQKLRTNYIGGDPQAVADALDAARASHANFRKTFTKQGTGDVVGPAIQKILGRQEGQAATPEEMTNLMYGTGGLPVKVGQRLINIFGAGSPEIGAAKQGLVSHIMQPPPGKSFTPEQVADRIDQYTRGPGSTLTRTYLSPQEVSDLQALSRQYRSFQDRAFAPVDPVEKTLRTVTGHDTQPRATSPEYIRDKLFDDVLDGKMNSDELQRRVLSRLSPTGKGTYAKGLFLHAVSRIEGVPDWGPSKVATRLAKLLDATQNTNTYSTAQRGVIKAYADFMQKLAMPTRGYSPSGPEIRRLGSLVASRIGGVIGAMIGHSLSPFPIMGELAGYTVGKQAERMAETKFNQISKTLPIVADQMARYDRALARYKTNQSVGGQKLAVSALANLNRSLLQLGINPPPQQ